MADDPMVRVREALEQAQAAGELAPETTAPLLAAALGQIAAGPCRTIVCCEWSTTGRLQRSTGWLGPVGVCSSGQKAARRLGRKSASRIERLMRRGWPTSRLICLQ